VSTTGRRDIRKGQIHVFSVLSSWKYPFKAIDVAAPENQLERDFVLISGKKTHDGQVVLPQIFHEEQCCGDYLDFLNAIEHEKMPWFLKQIEFVEHDESKNNETTIERQTK
jgi:hypothetical protein